LNGGGVASNAPTGLMFSDAGPVSIEAGIFKGAFTHLHPRSQYRGLWKVCF
jgi:hypothetical protein